MTKNINADLSDNCVFGYTKIKYKLLIIPKKIITFEVIKSNLKFK